MVGFNTEYKERRNISTCKLKIMNPDLEAVAESFSKNEAKHKAFGIIFSKMFPEVDSYGGILELFKVKGYIR